MCLSLVGRVTDQGLEVHMSHISSSQTVSKLSIEMESLQDVPGQEFHNLPWLRNNLFEYCEIASGMALVHSLGCIHRELKSGQHASISAVRRRAPCQDLGLWDCNTSELCADSARVGSDFST
jgi:hypothetical protein